MSVSTTSTPIVFTFFGGAVSLLVSVMADRSSNVVFIHCCGVLRTFYHYGTVCIEEGAKVF